jgi:hypothetical protein
MKVVNASSESWPQSCQHESLLPTFLTGQYQATIGAQSPTQLRWAEEIMKEIHGRKRNDAVSYKTSTWLISAFGSGRKLPLKMLEARESVCQARKQTPSHSHGQNSTLNEAFAEMLGISCPADALGGAITAYLGIVRCAVYLRQLRVEHPTLMSLVRKFPGVLERVEHVAAT